MDTYVMKKKMKRASSLFFCALVALHSQAQTLDFLYVDVFVALKRQCSETYPDLQDAMSAAVGDWIKLNRALLSPGLEQALETKPRSSRTYSREQCERMAATIPKEPMEALLQRAAQQREEDMRTRGEYERSTR